MIEEIFDGIQEMREKCGRDDLAIILNKEKEKEMLRDYSLTGRITRICGLPRIYSSQFST